MCYSRYLLACRPCDVPTTIILGRCRRAVLRVRAAAPAIRSDNGPPFASVGAGGLSRLSVWWLKLGIRPEADRPGTAAERRTKRMHSTLKARRPRRRRRTLAAQQRRFNRFRREFNEERRMRHSAKSRRLRLPRLGKPYPVRCANPPMTATMRSAACTTNGEISGAASSSSSARSWSANRRYHRSAGGDWRVSFRRCRARFIDRRTLKDPSLPRARCAMSQPPVDLWTTRCADRLRFPHVPEEAGTWEMLAFATTPTGPPQPPIKNDQKCYPCNRSKMSPIYPVAEPTLSRFA